MSLSIFIGSPRGKSSNSFLLADAISKGYVSAGGQKPDIILLSQSSRLKENIEKFNKSRFVLIIFPLYTDMIPAILKDFIEHLPEKFPDKKLGFIVQSGFPESIHSETTAAYLKNLAQESQADYYGTLIKGGVEGIQIMPPVFTRGLYRKMRRTGYDLCKYQAFNPEIVKSLAKPRTLNRRRILLFKIMMLTGMANYYWVKNLKANKAWQQRHAKPYSSA